MIYFKLHISKPYAHTYLKTVLKSLETRSLKNTWNSRVLEWWSGPWERSLRLTESTTFCTAVSVFAPTAQPISTMLNAWGEVGEVMAWSISSFSRIPSFMKTAKASTPFFCLTCSAKVRIRVSKKSTGKFNVEEITSNF